jgi:hypothetical protein
MDAKAGTKTVLVSLVWRWETNVVASGDFICYGCRNKGQGLNATAMGYGTATGLTSTAMGTETNAIGNHLMSMDIKVMRSWKCSIAM